MYSKLLWIKASATVNDSAFINCEWFYIIVIAVKRWWMGACIYTCRWMSVYSFWHCWLKPARYYAKLNLNSLHILSSHCAYWLQAPWESGSWHYSSREKTNTYFLFLSLCSPLLVKTVWMQPSSQLLQFCYFPLI